MKEADASTLIDENELSSSSDYRVFRLSFHPFYLGDLRHHGGDIDILWKQDWNSGRPGNPSKLHAWIDNRRA